MAESGVDENERDGDDEDDEVATTKQLRPAALPHAARDAADRKAVRLRSSSIFLPETGRGEVHGTQEQEGADGLARCGSWENGSSNPAMQRSSAVR